MPHYPSATVGSDSVACGKLLELALAMKPPSFLVCTESVYSQTFLASVMSHHSYPRW